MAVEIYPGPGTTSYQSTLYSVKVGGTSAYTYGVARQAIVGRIAGASTEMSWVTYGSDEVQSVEVTRLAGAITSAVVYPLNEGIEFSISNDKLTLLVPVRKKLYVEINGDPKTALMIFADTLKAAANDGRPIVTFSSQTSGISGSTLYFGPGVHSIGRLFHMPADSRMYLDGGAWVIGSLDVLGSNNVIVEGPGVLSGEDKTFESLVLTDPFETLLTNAAVYGYESGPATYRNGRVDDITIVNQPFYGVAYGVAYCNDLKIINPWHQNSDGFSMSAGHDTDTNVWGTKVSHCFSYVGDDNWKDTFNHFTDVIEDSFLVNSASAGLHFGYQRGDRDGTGKSECNRITLLNRSFTPASTATHTSKYSTANIKLWRDESIADSANYRRNIHLTDIWVEGGDKPLFTIENKAYPWGTPRDQRGDTAGIHLTRVYYTGSQAYKSRIFGRDPQNTPHDLSFDDVYFGDTKLTKANWSIYVDTNSFPYNITINGADLFGAAGQSTQAPAQLRSLAMSELDAVNTILLAIGSAPVNSIAGVVSADVAMARTVLEEAKLDTLLQGWSFNTEYDWVLNPRPDGRIVVPPAALRVDLTDYYDRSTDPVQRGQWLYNRKTRSYTWGSSITCNMILDLEWDELPQVCRRYIAALASRKMLSRVDGDQVAIRMAQMDELSALANMRQYQVDTQDATIFDAATSHWILNRGL